MVSTSRRSSAITPTESTLNTPLLTPSSFDGNEKSELAPNRREALADLKNKLLEKPELSNAMIWGVPLLTTESVLLKFLKAGDYNPETASKMISDTMRWRKEFGIDELIDQDLGLEEKSVFMHGYDKEGHPVCYMSWGDYNKLYEKISGNDAEKRKTFIRWQIQFLESNIIRKLDFGLGGICTILYVIDWKKPPGLEWSKEVNSAMDELRLLGHPNYPNFVFKLLYINVPWWPKVICKMFMLFAIEPTERKTEFVGPSTTAKTLAKYISPEQLPVKYCT